MLRVHLLWVHLHQVLAAAPWRTGPQVKGLCHEECVETQLECNQ